MAVNLFSLPPELRIRIYEYALACQGRNDDGTVELCNDGDVQYYRRPWPKGRHSVLALLETCQQIYKEAELIFWSVNHIAIPYQDESVPGSRAVDVGYSSAGCIRKRQIRAVEKLTLYVSVEPYGPFKDSRSASIVPALEAVSRLPKLRRLHLGLTNLHALLRWGVDITTFIKSNYEQVQRLLIQLGRQGLEDFRLVRCNDMYAPPIPDDRRWEMGLRCLVAQGPRETGKKMKRAELVVGAALPKLRLVGEEVDEQAEVDQALRWIEGEVQRYREEGR